MKFTEGYWRVREGFTAISPRSVHSTRQHGNELTIYAPVGSIEHRGNTLSNPEFTLSLESPNEGIIGLTVEHFRGQKRVIPDFLVHEEASDVEIIDSGDSVSYAAGSLALRFSKKDATFDVQVNGTRVTTAGGKSIGNLVGPGGQSYTYQELDLGIGSSVFGLGERFGPLAKNGQVVDMWNDDSGTSSDRSYKNIPFFFSTDGYGVFVDDPGDVSFEIGSEKVGRVQFSVRGQRLKYYIIAGPTPKDVLRRYTALTGRPPRLPSWSFGLWLSTSFLTDYDDSTVSGFIEGMAQRDIPLSAFHYDCFWMKEFQWCDFTWDDRWFQNPTQRITQHHEEEQLRVCVWINPYIGARSPLFDEGMDNGFLLRKSDGSVYQTDFWQSGMGIVDFTNPAAKEWYLGYIDRLLDQGVDSFKTDFGESIPTDVVYHDGSDPIRMHNYYTHLYNQAVFELLRTRKGEGEAVLFARSATAGGQQYPLHWGGDCEATYQAMSETIRGGLSLAASGFGYWAHDIGGFDGTPSPDVYMRWVAFGLLSSHSRLHGSHSPRVPWDFGEEAVDVLREFTLLKLSLFPHLAQIAEETVTEGIPMVRPMILEYPEDPAVSSLERQYMIGSNILVAPILNEEGRVDYYLPAGTWTNYLTGESCVGGRWVSEVHGVHSLPMMVREGAVIPTQPDRKDTEGDLLKDVTLRVFPTERSGESRALLRSGFTAESKIVSITVQWTPEIVQAHSEIALEGLSLQVGDKVVGFEGTSAQILRCTNNPS